MQIPETRQGGASRPDSFEFAVRPALPPEQRAVRMLLPGAPCPSPPAGIPESDQRIFLSPYLPPITTACSLL